MRTLSVKLPAALDAKLTATATERGVSKSAVIRRALETVLVGARGRRAASFLALAKDLAGCVRGRADLSHNPGRLRRYGR